MQPDKCQKKKANLGHCVSERGCLRAEPKLTTAGHATLLLHLSGLHLRAEPELPRAAGDSANGQHGDEELGLENRGRKGGGLLYSLTAVCGSLS